MHIEYECTLLEVNEKEFIQKIQERGAKKIGEFFQRRYVYDFNPVLPNKWIRLRTNGKDTTLAIKHIIDNSIIGGTQELEIKVDDFEKTNEMLNELGYFHRNYQENKRKTFNLDGVEIDIDTWPLIPTYVEFEGQNEEAVKNIIKKLDLDDKKIINTDVVSIYNDFYNIDIMSIKELRF